MPISTERSIQHAARKLGIDFDYFATGHYAQLDFKNPDVPFLYLIVTGAQVLPSILIILIIARFLKSFNDNPYVKGSLAFLRPVTTGLILVPVIQVIMFTLINPPETLSVLTTIEGLKAFFNWIPIAAYAVFCFLLFKVKLHPIGVIILGLSRPCLPTDETLCLSLT